LKLEIIFDYIFFPDDVLNSSPINKLPQTDELSFDYLLQKEQARVLKKKVC